MTISPVMGLSKPKMLKPATQLVAQKAQAGV
jgi:hypothetical protein